MQVAYEHEGRLCFHVPSKVAPLPFLSALRRYAYSRFPCVAIHKGTIRLNAQEGMRNETSFDDEYIARRLFLTPLKLRPGEERGLLFRIADPHNPQEPWRNRVGGAIYLRCKDVLVERNVDGGSPTPVDPAQVFSYPDMPLLKLGLGEGLLCDFRAAVGAKNAQYNPSGENCVAWQSISCFEFRPLLARDRVENLCLPEIPRLLGQDMLAPERDAKQNAMGHVAQVEMSAWPTGAQPAEVVGGTLEILHMDLERLLTAWRARDDTTFLLESESEQELRLVLANTDGDSLGNMLQFATNELLDEMEISPTEAFVGVAVIHMLVPQHRITLQLPSRRPGDITASQLFERAIIRCVEYVQTMLDQWNARTPWTPAAQSLPDEGTQKVPTKKKTPAPKKTSVAKKKTTAE